MLVQHDGMIAELVDANVRLAFAELRERDDASSVSSNGRGTAISVTIPRHMQADSTTRAGVRAIARVERCMLWGAGNIVACCMPVLKPP